MGHKWEIFTAITKIAHNRHACIHVLEQLQRELKITIDVNETCPEGSDFNRYVCAIMSHPIPPQKKNVRSNHSWS